MTAARKSDDHESIDFFSLFTTEIGWMGIVGGGDVVRAVFVGHPTSASVSKAVREWNSQSGKGRRLVEKNWSPLLKKRLMAYAEGDTVEFDDFELELPERTAFRDRVLSATRQIGYGSTTTYGELARRVGHPGAARAVGTVMSTNRFPILIPCHRVLAAGGRLGGYTAPAGTDLKQRLLDMEQHHRSVPLQKC